LSKDKRTQASRRTGGRNESNALLKQQKKVDKEPSAKAGRAKAKTKPKSKTKHVVK
jgi:hypothetical protein